MTLQLQLLAGCMLIGVSCCIVCHYSLPKQAWNAVQGRVLRQEVPLLDASSRLARNTTTVCTALTGRSQRSTAHAVWAIQLAHSISISFFNATLARAVPPQHRALGPLLHAVLAVD